VGDTFAFSYHYFRGDHDIHELEASRQNDGYFYNLGVNVNYCASFY
jgi:hypothetical protein